MWFDDENLKPEELIERRDSAKALADDWHGRMTSGLAAGHGAGLVALVAFLNAHPGLPVWWLLLAGTSAVAFLFGLLLIFVSMSQVCNYYEMRAVHFNMRINSALFQKEFAPFIDEREVKSFFDRHYKNSLHAIESFSRSYTRRQRIDAWSLVMLITGIFVGVASIAVGATATPTKPVSAVLSPSSQAVSPSPPQLRTP